MIKYSIIFAAVILISGDVPRQQPQIKNLPRILFLGDQITRGINDPSGFGFRDHVQNFLDPGLWDYVGPSANPPHHRFFDVDHAGEDWDWPSLTQTHIEKLLDKFMDPQAKNDLVLIHLGTVNIMKNKDVGIRKLDIKDFKKIYKGNLFSIQMGRRKKRRRFRPRKQVLDIEAMEDAGKINIKKDIKLKGAEAGIEELIEKITAYNSHIRIVLAKIIPCRNRIYNEKIKELNRWMEEMTKRRNLMRNRLNKKNNLFLADMYKVFINTPYWGEKLMSSTWYPNEKGYELMAGEWVRVIKQATADSVSDETL
jgi:hypothetical protein